jgi:zinc protease
MSRSVTTPEAPSLLRRLLLLILAVALVAGCGAAVRESAAPPQAGVAAGASPATAADEAAARAAATLPESAVAPLDPAVRKGRLENGLTYFVRRNARPEKRAELWLALDAGSTLEDDDQRGLAHFVEHMAFKGTARFKKTEIVDFLERIGMRFGPEVNAYTGFDETVYMLKVPTDDPAVVEKALQILGDWAQAVSFADEDVEKERGVIVEEWRLGRGAEARMRDQQLPTLFKASRYAERLTIGKKEIVEQAPADTIRRFYRDWYRPNLMAVVAVGDFDPAAMEDAIRTHFAPLRNPAAPRPRASFPVPGHDETLISVATDPEATSTRVSIYYKLPRQGRDTLADARRLTVEGLYHGMINARLNEIRQQPDPPFLWAGSGAGSLVRSSDVVSQSAGVDEKGLARGLETLLVELARVEAHGFTAAELERAKTEQKRAFEQAFRERDKQESDAYASEMLRAFLEGEMMPGIAFERALNERLLPAITLDEVNHLARAWSGERNRVILVNAPEKAGRPAPTEADIREIFRAAQAKTVAPWVDRVREEPLVANPPRPGTLVEETAADDLGVTRWKLSNGVRVILKPTDFKNDQVLLTGFSPGGNSLVPDAQYLSATYAGSVLAEGGLGSFDQIELQKALTGKVAGASGFVGELEEGVGGGASPQDLETMFQLLYLKFTAPRADPGAFASWKVRQKGYLENQLARPETVFSDALSVALSQGHFRRRPMSVALLDEIDLKTAEAVWRDRFADAGDFTFVIVGKFQPAEIRPLVLTYLGGLPANGRTETWRDVGVRPPPGVEEVTVRKGIEPKSQVRIVFTGEARWTRQDDHLIGSLGQALRIRLREVLRDDKGGAYGFGAGGGISRRPVERYRFGVSFGCAPDRVAELRKTVFDLLEEVKREGFSEELVAKVREQQVREQEEALKENGFWLGTLAEAARFGEDPHELLRHDELVRLVTVESMREAARRYLDPARLVVGVLYPETAGQ